MAYVTIPYSFTTGTASDAGKVNANFTALANGLSDGSKDLYVSHVKATSATITHISGTTFIGSEMALTSATVTHISNTSVIAQQVFATNLYVGTLLAASGAVGATTTFTVSGISLTFTHGVLTNQS